MTSLGSVLYLLLLLLMVCWPTGCQVDVRGEVQEEGRLLNDFHFLSVFIDDRNNNDAFSLHLSTLPTWKTRAEKFFESYGPEAVKRAHLSVQNLLKEHEVEESKLLADWPTAFRTDLHLQTDLQTDRTDLKHAPRELTTSSVLRTLNTGVVWDVESTTLSSKHVQKHKAYRKVKARQTLFAEHNQPRPNHASILDLIAPQKQSTLPVFLREIASPIVLYQSLNTSTGGTTAMRLLYHALKDMHYQHVLLCNESNYLTKACRRPSGKVAFFPSSLVDS